jgi:hypothetical protein
MTLIGFYFISVFAEAFAFCHPVAFNWDKSIRRGYCSDTRYVYLGAGITNLVLDVIVVVLPIPTLIGLKIVWRKKVGIVGMFSLGIL